MTVSLTVLLQRLIGGVIFLSHGIPKLRKSEATRNAIAVLRDELEAGNRRMPGNHPTIHLAMTFDLLTSTELATLRKVAVYEEILCSQCQTLVVNRNDCYHCLKCGSSQDFS